MTTMEDIKSMTRKQLQALCKKHGVPANLKNAEMVKRLSSLLKDEESGAKEQSASGEINVMEVGVKKKVRFHAENEVFDVDMYSEMIEKEQAAERRERAARRGLRKHGLAKAGNNNAVEIASSETGEIFTSQIRMTRSRKSIVIRSPPLRKKAKSGEEAGSETGGQLSYSHCAVTDSVHSNAEKEKESEEQVIAGKVAKLAKRNLSTSLDSEPIVGKQNINEVPMRKTRSQIKVEGDGASIPETKDAKKPVTDDGLLGQHRESAQHELPLRKSSRRGKKIEFSMPENQRIGTNGFEERHDEKRVRNESSITNSDTRERNILSREEEEIANPIKENFKSLRSSRFSIATSTSTFATGFEVDSGKENQKTCESLQGESPIAKPQRRTRRKSCGYDAMLLSNANSLPGSSNQINQPTKGKRNRGLQRTYQTEKECSNEDTTSHGTQNSIEHDLLVKPMRQSKPDGEKKQYKRAKRSARLKRTNWCIDSCPVENDLINKDQVSESKDVSSSELLGTIEVVADGISSVKSLTPYISEIHAEFVEARVAPQVEESTMSTAEKASVLVLNKSTSVPAVGKNQIAERETSRTDADQRDPEFKLPDNCSESSDPLLFDVPSVGSIRYGTPKISVSNLSMEVGEKNALPDDTADYDTLLSTETEGSKGIEVNEVEEASVSHLKNFTSVQAVGEIQVTACDTDAVQRKTHVLSDEEADYDNLLSTETQMSDGMEVGKVEEAPASILKRSSTVPAAGEMQIIACDADVVKREIQITTCDTDAVQRETHVLSDDNYDYDNFVSTETQMSDGMEVSKVEEASASILKRSSSVPEAGEMQIIACDADVVKRENNFLSDDKADYATLLSNAMERNDVTEVSKVEDASVSDVKQSSSVFVDGEIQITTCDTDIVQRETFRGDAVQRDVEIEVPENFQELPESFSYAPHVGFIRDETADYVTLVSAEGERTKGVKVCKVDEGSGSDSKISSWVPAVGEIQITAYDADVVQRETLRSDAVQKDLDLEIPEACSQCSDSFSYDVPPVASSRGGISQTSNSNLSIEVREKYALSNEKADSYTFLSTATEISKVMEVSNKDEAMEVFVNSLTEGEDRPEVANNHHITIEVSSKEDICAQIWSNTPTKQNADDGESKEILNDAEQFIEAKHACLNGEGSFNKDKTMKEPDRVATYQWQPSPSLLGSEIDDNQYGDINKDEMASDEHASANEQGQCSLICNPKDVEDGHWKQNSESFKSTPVHDLTCNDKLYHDKCNSERALHDHSNASKPHLVAPEDGTVIQLSEPLEASQPIEVDSISHTNTGDVSTSEIEVISIGAGSSCLWNSGSNIFESKEVSAGINSRKDSSPPVSTNIDENATNHLFVEPTQELDIETNDAPDGSDSSPLHLTGECKIPGGVHKELVAGKDDEFSQYEDAECTDEGCASATLHATGSTVGHLRNAVSNDVSVVSTPVSVSFHESLAERYADKADAVDYSSQAYSPNAIVDSIINKTTSNVDDSFLCPSPKKLKYHDDYNACICRSDVSQELHNEFITEYTEEKGLSLNYLGPEDMIEYCSPKAALGNYPDLPLGLENFCCTDDTFKEPSCLENALADQASVSSKEAIVECITDDCKGERDAHSIVDSRVKHSMTDVMNGDEDDNTISDMSNKKICYDHGALPIAKETSGEILSCHDAERILMPKDTEVASNLEYKASIGIGDLKSVDQEDCKETNVKMLHISKEIATSKETLLSCNAVEAREGTSSSEIHSFDKLDGLLQEIDDYFEWRNSSEKVFEGNDMTDDSKETNLNIHVETTTEAAENKTNISHVRIVDFHESECNFGTSDEVYATHLEGQSEQMIDEIAANDEKSYLMIEDCQFDDHPGYTLKETCSEQGMAGYQSGGTLVNHAEAVQNTPNQAVSGSDLDLIRMDTMSKTDPPGNEVASLLLTEDNPMSPESGMENTEDFTVDYTMLFGTDDMVSEHFADVNDEDGLNTDENAGLIQDGLKHSYGDGDASDSNEVKDGNLNMHDSGSNSPDTTQSPCQVVQDRDFLIPASSCDSKSLSSSNENVPAVCHNVEEQRSEVYFQPASESTLEKLETAFESDGFRSSADGYVEVALKVLHYENVTEIPSDPIVGLDALALEKDDHNSDDKSATVDSINNQIKCEGSVVALNLRVVSSLSNEAEMFDPSQGFVAQDTTCTPHCKKSNHEEMSYTSKTQQHSAFTKQHLAKAMKENITPFSKTDPLKCTKTAGKRRVLDNIRNN